MEALKIADKISKLRMKKGISKTQMADDLGLTVASISYYEKGERIPSDEVKIKMANYFGKSVQEIFFDE